MNKKTTEQRFWDKVDKNGPIMPGMDTPCWIWLASKHIDDGYGGFQFNGKYGKAHRYSYLLHNGELPEDLEIRHICHNPACVNPDHLVLGTHTDNMRDLALSGRRKGFRRKVRGIRKDKPTPEERFWASVNKDGPTMPHMDSPCWTWKLWIGKDGYGRISIFTKLTLAHRFSYELHYGPIPNGLDILHACDNPSCVNPDHLTPGTHQANMQDMVKRGRHIAHRGEQNNTSKLTQSQVDEIRKRYMSANVTQVQLAKDYGVTQAAIWYILKGRNWAK